MQVCRGVTIGAVSQEVIHPPRYWRSPRSCVLVGLGAAAGGQASRSAPADHWLRSIGRVLADARRVQTVPARIYLAGRDDARVVTRSV